MSHGNGVLTQEIIAEAAIAVYGEPVARHTDAGGTIAEYDLSGEWPVRMNCEAVSGGLGEEVTAGTRIEVRRGHSRRICLQWERDASCGHLLDQPERLVGMVIDRLVTDLTGLGIRDTVKFPLVRPRG